MIKVASFKGNKEEFKEFIDSLIDDSKKDDFSDIRDIEGSMQYILKNISELGLKQNALMSEAEELGKKIQEYQSRYDQVIKEIATLNSESGKYRCELIKLSNEYCKHYEIKEAI